MSEFPKKEPQSDVPDSDHKCTCTHTAFDHMGAAGTGRCVRCTCTEFKRDLDEKAA
jgi:hypothetical protein